MDKPKKEKKKGKGAVLVFDNGKVMRTNPTGMSGVVNYDAIDTSGYSKGKKVFAKESGMLLVGKTIMGPVIQKGKNTQYTPVKRKDVLKELNEMKKGANKTTDFRNKNKSSGSELPKVKNKKALQAVKNAISKVNKKIEQKKASNAKYKF